MRKKEKKNIPTKKTIALVVDGESEKWYINQIQKYETEKVHFTLKPELPKGKSLEDMYNKVIELEKNEDFDKIFWIVDFDVIIKESKEAKKGIRTKLDFFKSHYKDINKDRVIVIINNPCLEYWFLQHYEETSKYFSKCAEIEEILIKHIKDYSKKEKFYNSCNGGKGIYSFLKPDLKTAIANSKKLKGFDFSKSDVKDYEIGLAEMYKLFEELGIE